METETFIRMAIFIGGAMFGCSAGVFMICPVHGRQHAQAQTQEAAMKRINHTSAKKIKWILAKRASQAVNEANASAPRLYNWPSKTASRWNPCRCLICNLDFDMMTNLHAESHGFASADELIASGNVRFM